MKIFDINNAYYTITVDETYQKYSTFQWEVQLYCFTCLPNGLGPCPRKFTKVLKPPPLTDLRKMGQMSSAYIDDIYLQGSYEGCVANVIYTTISFDNLGFTIHPEKIMFYPQTSYYTFIHSFRSKEMPVRLTPEMANNEASFCKFLLEAQSCQ